MDYLDLISIGFYNSMTDEEFWEYQDLKYEEQESFRLLGD